MLDGNRILCEQLLGIPSGTISYIYSDEEVIGFIYGGSKYLYLKNLQNDIIGIVDSNGNIVARYVYDALGNHKVCNPDGTSNTNVRFIGNINPFRYRGYYYHVETGLFMVGHRYYNPEWGRWLSPDSIEYLDPQSINGLNLYAYCGNDPVNRIDPSGHDWYNVLWDLANTIAGLLNPISKITALGSVIIAAINGRWSDLAYDWNEGCFDPFNQSESVVLNSKVLSFYKGSTVVRQNILGTGSFLGTIWLNKSKEHTLDHEYGHSIQERILGASYLINIGIPSALYNFYDKKYNLPSIDYYSMPWERSAEFLAGINRKLGYKQYSLEWALLENSLGPVIIPFYFIYGY